MSSKFMNFGGKKSLDFLDNIRENVISIMKENGKTVFSLGMTSIDNKHLVCTLLPEEIYPNIIQFDNLKERFDSKIKKFNIPLKSIDYLMVD